MPLRKAVIPAAGFGTRMLPAAKAVPKELLPILDRPTIQCVIEEAAAGGIDDCLLVTSRDKRAIEDHFDRNLELESRLQASGRESLLTSITDLSAKIKIHSVRQPEPRGLGDAVAQARRHVGDEPFVCLLGDTIFSGDPLPTQQLAGAFREFGTSIIGLEEVPADRVGRYGIVGGTRVRDGVLKLDTLIEKPSPDQAPSRYAIAARYVLTPAIFACLEQTSPGKGGEIQLTDALRLLLSREPIHGVVLNATRHDIGNPIDWLKTNLTFAARNEQMWSQIAPLARQLLAKMSRDEETS
jgi:UTP--glucose-1-phosphate uridylyltransferase